MSSLAETPFLRLLPESLRNDADAIAAAESLSKRSLFNEDVAETLILFDPDTLSKRDSKLLDYLFSQEHVDIADPEASAEEKAKLIFSSPAIHMRKGTSWSVEEVIRAFYKNAEMREWFQYDGKPYHFKVRILDTAPDIQEIPRLIRMIFATKNIRSVLEGIYFQDARDVSFQVRTDGDGYVSIAPLLDFQCGIGMPGSREFLSLAPAVEGRTGTGFISFANEMRCGSQTIESKGMGDRSIVSADVETQLSLGVHHQQTIEMELNASLAKRQVTQTAIGGQAAVYESSPRSSGTFSAGDI